MGMGNHVTTVLINYMRRCQLAQFYTNKSVMLGFLFSVFSVMAKNENKGNG